MNKEPSQVKKSKDEILMQVCNITDKEEWSYVEHITPIQALKAMEEYRSQASDLLSDDEIESLSVKRYRGEDLDEQKRNSKLILAFEDGLKQMRSIASPLLASHVARIKELEERPTISSNDIMIELFAMAGMKNEDGMKVIEYLDKENGGSIAYLRHDAVVKTINKLTPPKP